jgi:hypothetical protein
MPTMSKPLESTSSAAITVSDVRGLAQAGFDAVVGITDLVEAVHHTIVQRAGVFGPAPRGRTTGLTGFVYRTVRGTTRLVGGGVNAALGSFDGGPLSHSAPGREAVLAVLNGIWGDYLADAGNPLAIPMSLRAAGRTLDLADDVAGQIAEPRPRLVVLVHGLCMNDVQWQRRGHDHGRQLAALGYTPLYLRYNSGRHVSQNGREFSALLEQLVEAWPVRIRELAIVGHSMGGLLARSASHYANEANHGWLAKLTRLAFLGTPHHGAVLERGGHLVDRLLGASPYAAPFVRLGGARSAGITDLRYGNLRDEDWVGRSPLEQSRDQRLPTPLPSGVDAYLIAATLGRRARPVGGDLIGDTLVPLASALGQHPDRAHALEVPASRQRVFYRTNHWDLLSRHDVGAQLCSWLARPRRRTTATR